MKCSLNEKSVDTSFPHSPQDEHTRFSFEFNFLYYPSLKSSESRRSEHCKMLISGERVNKAEWFMVPIDHYECKRNAHLSIIILWKWHKFEERCSWRICKVAFKSLCWLPWINPIVYRWVQLDITGNFWHINQINLKMPKTKSGENQKKSIQPTDRRSSDDNQRICIKIIFWKAMIWDFAPFEADFCYF